MIEMIEQLAPLRASEPKPEALFFKLADDGRRPVRLSGYSEWWEWNHFEAENTQIARTELGGHLISTVFSGVVADPAHVFETMIFAIGKDGRPHYKKHLALWVCPTRDEAQLQHQIAIRWLEEQLEAAKTWNLLR